MSNRILEGQTAVLHRRVRHLKTGGIYRVLTAALLEANMTAVVVYQSENDGQVWVRPVVEFIDGRFEQVT